MLEKVAAISRGSITNIDSKSIDYQKLQHLRQHGYVMLDHLVGSKTFISTQKDYQKRIEKNLEFELPCMAQSLIDPQRDKDLIESNFLATTQQLTERGLTFNGSDITSYGEAIEKYEPSTLKVVLPQTFDYFNLWLDPQVLQLVENYMGFTPQLVEAYLRRNFPAKFKVMNHAWHRDRNHPKHLLKAFIFLSDCTLNTGPHHYISGSIKDDQLNNKPYFTDDEVLAAYPQSSGREITSVVKAGTIILEDTRGLHKAGVPEEGYRDLGFSVFLPQVAFVKKAPLYTIKQNVYDQLSNSQKKYVPTENILQ